jgi:hypothetical protein
VLETKYEIGPINHVRKQIDEVPVFAPLANFRQKRIGSHDRSGAVILRPRNPTEYVRIRAVRKRMVAHAHDSILPESQDERERLFVIFEEGAVLRHPWSQLERIACAGRALLLEPLIGLVEPCELKRDTIEVRLPKRDEAAFDNHLAILTESHLEGERVLIGGEAKRALLLLEQVFLHKQLVNGDRENARRMLGQPYLSVSDPLQHARIILITRTVPQNRKFDAMRQVDPVTG